ncbi:MAG: FtsW/RodA/SpoVE family cell cycle protein, partial [Xanthomonadales bacterium]|nr:FtsW/RodA/SpoVE family cell cycle protein [Xanthomonadales bacterium]
LLLASPAVAASLAVLAVAEVDRNLWLMQIVAICLACAVAAAGLKLSGWTKSQSRPAMIVALVALIGLAVPLLSGASGPERWAAIGPVNLYMAPVVLPAFLVAFAVLLGDADRQRWFGLAAAVGASVLLAIQPDASQALALLAGIAVTVAMARTRYVASGLTLGLIAMATAWAFSRPDPLQPIPHVEGVFLLALEHSFLTGVIVIGSAISILGGLYALSKRGQPWLFSVAGYYAVLYACSVVGLTPAPLIGYGAGPLLGFGLLVAISRWAGTQSLSTDPEPPAK